MRYALVYLNDEWIIAIQEDNDEYDTWTAIPHLSPFINRERARAYRDTYLK